jgi:hypothetical protein
MTDPTLISAPLESWTVIHSGVDNHLSVVFVGRIGMKADANGKIVMR